MNKIINESAGKVANLYKGLSYGDQYGTSVIITVILLVILFVVYSYYKSKINSQPIRDNWNKYRCYPDVIPFAGMINAPEGESVNNYTQMNFNYCLNEMVKPVTKLAVNPLDYLMQGLIAIYGVIAKIITYIRQMIDKVRNAIMAIVANIWQRILKFLIPIQEMIIRTMDLFAKSLGTMKVAMQTLIGGYITFKSGVGFMVTAGAFSLIVGAAALLILYGMAIAAILLMPWTLGFVLGLIVLFTTAYIIVMVFVLIIINFMDSVMEVRPQLPGIAPPPGKPKPPPKELWFGCFDKNTLIKMENGNKIPIIDIKIGDVLSDGGKVTSVFQTSSFSQKMFLLDGVLVSGTHYVKYGNKWTTVKDHPESFNVELIEPYKEPILYCLNTTTKQIPIHDTIFSDWDEIDDEFEGKLHDSLKKINKLTEKKELFKDKSYIHHYFDGGFSKDALIDLQDGVRKKIKNIKVGDKLRDGSFIYGTVKIDKSDLSLYKSLDSSSYNQLHLEKSNKSPLYHLLIYGGNSKFVVNGECVADYNNYLDSME